MEVEIPKGNRIIYGYPKERKGLPQVEKVIKEKLNSPIHSPPLRELAKGKRKAAIVVDDNTRPVPNKILLPPLLEELHKAGLKKENIIIIIGLGLHPPLSREEKRKLLGKIAENYRVYNHNPRGNLTSLGKSKRGIEVALNRYFMNSDLKILVGDVEYHQLFGYGGGPKSVHPGIADEESIRVIHSWMDLPGAEAGKKEGNPLQEEIEEIAIKVGVDFILNVVLNSQKEIVGVFAGQLISAFQEGIKMVDEMYKIPMEEVDTVITSCGGYPRDIDLYQAQKAIEAAKKIVKKGGKIFLFAECRRGWGSKIFEDWVKEAKSPQEIKERIKKKFIIGAHKAYLFAKEVEWAKIYVYSSMKEEVREAFLTPLSSPSQVKEIIGKEEKVGVLPYGTVTLPVKIN